MFGRMKASIVMSQGASIARDQLEIKIEYVHAGATSVRNAMMREITRNKIMEIDLNKYEAAVLMSLPFVEELCASGDYKAPQLFVFAQEWRERGKVRDGLFEEVMNELGRHQSPPTSETTTPF